MASEHYSSMPSSPGFDVASPMSLSPPGSPETAASLRAKSRAELERKGVYGLKLGLLRQWENEKREQLLGSEHALQEIAVSKVRGFLDAIGCVVKIQSWVRMLKPFHAHLAFKRTQRETKRIYYRAMRLFWKSERLYRVQVFGKFFIGWREEARTSKKLKILITQFFRICIQRLRLTPQACMAFFNPGEWSSAIAKSDMLKIRRLMLEKLFFGWRTETRELRMVRYKASQILSRMVRRTKGQLWVKESTLVCFHMWYRYILVKKAYRMDLPDPRFTNPMLPQWTRLQKEITIQRIKRRRTKELASYLTRMRSFKNWKRLMSIDRTKPVTPLAVAIMHYSTVLVGKVLRAWHDIIRERGRMMRFRTKLFYTWRQWAPKHRQMRHFNDQAKELIRLRRVQRAYGVMIKLCFNVIGTRTERIKELRRNFCDRRVVICAYALLHKDSHMMMVDCWRRLYFYWKSRRSWKSVSWHFAYEWHAHKMKVIFGAWKSLTQQPAPLPPSYSCSPAVMLARSGKHLSHVTERDEDNSWQSTPYGALSRADSVDSVNTTNSDEHNTNHPVGSPSKSPTKAQVLTAAAAAAAIAASTGSDHPQPPPGTPGGTVRTSTTPSEAGSRPTSAGSTQGTAGLRRRQSSLRGKVMFSNPYSSSKLSTSVKTPNYEKLVRDFVPKGLSIVQRGVEGKLPTKLTALQFRTFCFALSRSYAQLATRLHDSIYGGKDSSCRSRTVSTSAIATATLASLDEGSLPPPTPTVEDAAAGSSIYAHRPLPHFPSSADSMHSESTAAVVTSTSATLERTDYEVAGFQELHFPVQKYYNRALQERLQTAIDEVDVEAVLSAVTEGAVIETSHMRQLGVHIGDMYMPLFTLLLTNSTQFFVDRVVKQDAQQLLLEIQNPISAYLAGSQIERWLRAEVSYRETMQLTQDMPTQRYISGEFSSYYLMRFIILKNIDMKAKRLLHLCVMLPEHRTVDEEVPEVLKRQKLAKLYSLRKSLTEMVGDDDSFQETYLAAMSAIPPLVQPPPRQASTPYAQVRDTAGKDIYTVLREFTLLTGKLTKEAKSVRAPLMERDQRLIDNGFLRQARADFLALRQECLTDKQRAEILAKQKKAEEKERKALEKQKKAERKKKEKRTGSQKKKGKKGRAAAEVADLNFDSLDNQTLTSDDEGYTSENGGEGTHLSDLCQLTFLEGGLDIGEESDLQHDQDFQARTAHFKHPMFLESFRRYGWREKAEVRGAIERGMVASMRGTLRRVMAVLQADKTIGKLDLATARSRYRGIGQYLVNHALSHLACRRSPTWYVLPKDYWSFRTVRERVHLELAVTDATITAIKSRLSANHSATHSITNDISMYQKFLKQTRKEFMKIAEKRTHKAEADAEERAPFLARMKKCDIRTKGAQQAIESIREKLRRAEVQVATGNLTGAAEVFIPPEDPTVASNKKDGKKGKGDAGKAEAPAVVYNYKAVHALMEAATQEIQRLEDSISEQAAVRQQCEKEVRMYDWQCQRTSRMLRDLAEGRFQMMIDVQQVAVREAKHLDSTEDTAEVQTMRYKSMRRYYNHLMGFLEGPITERGQQLAREAEQRRVSEVLKGSPSGRTDFSSPAAAQAAAQMAASKKRGALASGEEVDSLSFRSQLDSRGSSEADLFLDRGASAGTDGFGIDVIEEDDRSAVDSVFSDGDSSLVQEERRRHEAELNEKAAAVEALLGTEDLEPADTRTSSQIAVDAEIELAHHNSLENRQKREAALQLLAEEQARELATQDLRLRVFEDYWNALPQNAERVLRKKTAEQDTTENIEEVTVAEIKSSYLNRSDRMWKAIGTSYWKEKEETVRAMLVNGEDVSEARLRMVREVDPLDEDLNELVRVAPKVQFADEVDDSLPGTADQHLQSLSAFEETSGLWKATPHADHVKMMSVSMKELNSEHTERRDSQASDSQAGDDSSVGSRAGGAPPPISRQGSSAVGRMTRQVSRQASRQGTQISRNNSEQSIGAKGGGARGAANPDPFSLVGRDEYLRFVDHSHPQPTSSDVPSSEETEMLRLELGHITNPHMPTLQEGGTDAEGGELGSLTEETGPPACSPSSPSAKSPMAQIRLDAKALLKMMGFSTRSLKTTSSRTSTFEDFDKIFDKMTDSIVGALEKTHSQKIDPALIAEIMNEDEDSDDWTPEETPEGSLTGEPLLPSAIIENANRNTSSHNTSRRGSFGSTQSDNKTPTAEQDKAVKFETSPTKGSRASSRRPSLTSPTELTTTTPAAKSPSPTKRCSFSGTPLDSSASSRPSSSLSTPQSSDKRHTIAVGSTTGKHSHPDGAKAARRASFDGKKPVATAITPTPTASVTPTPTAQVTPTSTAPVSRADSSLAEAHSIPVFTDSIATVTATAAVVDVAHTPAAAVVPSEGTAIAVESGSIAAPDSSRAVAEALSAEAPVQTGDSQTATTSSESEGLVATSIPAGCVSVIPEGSVESSQMSLSSAATPPPPLALQPQQQQQRSQPSRSPSKILFSDELITSSRDACDEDDVRSEMSAQVFIDERGNAVLYGTDGAPITKQHPEYERMRLQQRLLGHVDSPSLSRLGSPQGSALPSARSAAHSVQSSRQSVGGTRSRLGDTFDESATSVTKALMENISTMSVEPEPSYSDSPGQSARYLPERELREAIFGGQIDTGAAGLESLLQSFASNNTDHSHLHARKAGKKVEEDQGCVAVPVGGEWVLQRSTASPPRPYSPKIQPFSPSHTATAGSRNGFGTVSSPPLHLAAPHLQPQAPEHFLMQGVGLCSRAPEEAPRQPSVLISQEHMRLVEKLGLDIQQQQAQHQDTAVQEGAGDVDIEAGAGAEVNQDLLSLVQEFYDEKAAEEERLEQLKKRSTSSYFPPSFRQSKDLSQSSDAASQGEFRHLLDTDWFDDDVSETGSVDSPMRQLQLQQQQTEGAVDVQILRKHSNSMVGASFARGSFDALTPEMSNKFTRRNSTKSLQELPQFTNDEILAAVAAVVGTVNASRDAQPQHLKAPSGVSSATLASELVVGAPVRRLSTRMERMLNRRDSYNPTEVRLELLDSLNDNEASVLEQELDSAVKEVRKYLQDRETERHRVTPKGRLRNKESFAQSYREAVQRRGNPHKMLSIQRTAQIQAEQQALLQRQSQRRPSPPASPLVSTLFAPDDPAVQLPRNVQGQRLGDAGPLVSGRRDSLSSQESAGQLEHPSRSQSAAVQYAPGRVHFSGLGTQDTARDTALRNPTEYITKRAGTPDFWVDVTKLSPTANPAAGQKVTSLHRTMGDELSMVSGDAREGSQLSEESAGQPVLMLDVASGVDYQNTSVLGFSKEDRAILAASHSLQQAGGSRGGAPPPLQLNLQVTAVKLDHPVRAQLDPKTEGQYHLYRERSPLRSSRRSLSPPSGRVGPQGHSADHHVGAGVQKHMVYSHSDGLLAGVNAVVTGTKAKLNATTGKFPGYSHADDSLDERSAGGDTFNSSLSPMTFNLMPRPASPPLPKSTPHGFDLGSPVEGQSSRRSGSSPGTPLTPSRAGMYVAGAEEGAQGVLHRSRPSSSRLQLHRAHSETTSNPTSRPATPAVLAAAALAAGKLDIVGMSGSIDADLSAPDRSSTPGPGTAPGSSRCYRDYRTSASASKIISEIAGEPYITGCGPGQITGSSSAAGTVTAGGSIVSIEATPNDQVHPAKSNMHLPTDGTLSFTFLPGRPSSSSPTSKRALEVTNYVFSPDSVDTEGFQATNTGTSYISVPGSRSRSPSPSPPQVSAGASRAPTPLNIALSSENSLRSSITATAKPSAKEAPVPSNIVTATSRKMQLQAPQSADFLIVPQSMSGLALINDRSQKVSRNNSTSFAATRSSKVKSSKTNTTTASAAVRRSASAVALLPWEIAGTDLDSVPSCVEDLQMPAPVKKIEVSVQSATAVVATRSTRTSVGGLLEVGEKTAAAGAVASTAEGDAQTQALLEAQMEADIEVELRQMLSEQHQEEEREAYRAAYYRQNKSFLANAGVAVQKHDSHKGSVPAAVPFVAGSSSHPTPNTTVSARVAGLSSAERIRMSASVGGGGFSGHRQGVLHKVKGAQLQHSASATMLPPLDPSILLDSALSAVPVSPTGKRRQKTRSRRGGDRETHNIDSLLAASPDALVHNKLKLAALLHTTATGTVDPEPSQPTPQESSLEVAAATRYATRGPTRASMADVAIAMAAGMKSNTAAAQLDEQDTLLYGNNSSSAVTGPVRQQQHSRLQRDNSVDSLNSMGSSSAPLQSIHAPAVEVTHLNSSGKARTGLNARFS